VYRDDEVRKENFPLVICNALKPRKLDDDEEFKCVIAVFEPEDLQATVCTLFLQYIGRLEGSSGSNTAINSSSSIFLGFNALHISPQIIYD
jgi:hypothetical protein